MVFFFIPTTFLDDKLIVCFICGYSWDKKEDSRPVIEFMDFKGKSNGVDVTFIHLDCWSELNNSIGKIEVFRELTK